MSGRKVLRGVILDSRTTLSLQEFCHACGAEETTIVTMVEEGVIEPIGPQHEWQFPGDALARARCALRLVHDLGVNWPGAALALDLLDRLEQAERANR